MKKYLTSLLLLSCFLNTSILADDRIPVKIGVITPLTTAQAYNGETIKRTAELTREFILDKSTKYNYSFSFEDGKCGDGSAAATAAQRFINVDGIRFIVVACSGSTIQAAPIAEKYKTLLIAVLSSHKDIKHLGDYVFRTYLDVEKASRKLAGVIKSDGNKRVAVLTEDNTFTIGISDIIEEEIGGIKTLSDNFPFDSTDFRSILMRVKASKPDALYLSMASPTSAANMMNQIHQLKIPAKIYMFHMPDLNDFIPLVNNNADGLKYLGTPKLSEGSPEYQRITSEYIKRYDEGPSFDLVMRTTFDAIMAIYDGIEASGPDAEKVKDFLYTYKTQGALGPVAFDKNGDVKDLDYALKEIKGEKKVFLE